MIRRAFGPLLVLTIAAGCADTLVEAPETTPPASSMAFTTPAGSTAELLAQLAAVTQGLSARIIDNEGDEEALARVELLWTEAARRIEAERPELLRRFEAVIAHLRRSVERRRPADADKAHNNLVALIDAYGR